MDEPEALAQRLVEAVRWFDAGVAAQLRRQGYPADVVGRPHALLLNRIDPGGAAMAVLAREAGVSRQFVHQLVRELAGLGLVQVEPDPRSQRSKLVRPTEQGLEAKRAAASALAVLEQQLARRLGAPVYAGLREALERDWGPPDLSVDPVGRPL